MLGSTVKRPLQPVLVPLTTPRRRLLERHRSNYCSSCNCTISALAVQNGTKQATRVVLPDNFTGYYKEHLFLDIYCLCKDRQKTAFHVPRSPAARDDNIGQPTFMCLLYKSGSQAPKESYCSCTFYRAWLIISVV